MNPDVPPNTPAPVSLREMRRAYEWGRLRFAIERTAPLVALAALATLMFPSLPVASISLALVVSAVSLQWRGGPMARSIVSAARVVWVLPVLLITIEPFGLACGVNDCAAMFGPACVVAGLIGGFLIARHAIRSRSGIVGWSVALALVAGAGALGCFCVGAGSTFGLVAGLLATSAPALPKLLSQP